MFKPIILASNSPRRKQVLENLGLKFQVICSEFEEVLTEDICPYELPAYFAIQKARDVAQKVNYDSIIIAADTIVICNEILGKPANEEEAYKMLKAMSGNVHEVVTGIGIIDRVNNIEISDREITKVYFKKISDDEIYKYIQSGEYMDKAGSYGIQGKASLFIEKIEGDYFNVVGLPVCKLGVMLQEYFNYSLL